MRQLRARVFNILDTTSGADPIARAFGFFSIALILVNVGAIIGESVGEISGSHRRALDLLEASSVTVFTVEYLARVWTAPASSRYAGSVRGRFKFVITPLALIDLLSVLPYYAPMLLGGDLRFVRALRLFRLVRVFKLGRYSRSLRIIMEVLKRKREELAVTFCGGLLVLIVASILMYHLEHGAQPDVFTSIPAAMWWGVATFTTVGYGDVLPITPAGKFLGSIAAVIGIGLFALPAGILGSGFSEVLRKDKKPRKRFAACPHCGKPLLKRVEGKEDSLVTAESRRSATDAGA